MKGKLHYCKFFGFTAVIKGLKGFPSSADKGIKHIEERLLLCHKASALLAALQGAITQNLSRWVGKVSIT